MGNLGQNRNESADMMNIVVNFAEAESLYRKTGLIHFLEDVKKDCDEKYEKLYEKYATAIRDINRTKGWKPAELIKHKNILKKEILELSCVQDFLYKKIDYYKHKG